MRRDCFQRSDLRLQCDGQTRHSQKSSATDVFFKNGSIGGYFRDGKYEKNNMVGKGSLMVTCVCPQIRDAGWYVIVASWFWTSSSVLQGAILIVLALLLPAPALADKPPGPESTPNTPTPQIIQHLSTVANAAASGEPNSNTYQIDIAPTGSGDTMILSITALYGHGTPRVTDSASDPSPAAICDAYDGSGSYISYIYAFQPSAGVRWLKVTFSTPIPFDWEVTEFNHLGATSQGSECQAGLPSTSGTVTPRGFTPTNNNSTGGNLIYNYTALASAAGCNARSYSPATGFTLLILLSQ
jgi:hypothetical protein